MSQTQRITGRATAVFTDADHKTKVVYHSTPVVSFDEKEIILNTGGWRTTTTRTRMNQASNQFRLEYQVVQKDFAWYVIFKGETIPFQGEILLLNRN